MFICPTPFTESVLCKKKKKKCKDFLNEEGTERGTWPSGTLSKCCNVRPIHECSEEDLSSVERIVKL